MMKMNRLIIGAALFVLGSGSDVAVVTPSRPPLEAPHGAFLHKVDKDLFLVQLTFDNTTMRAKFEFIINNPGGHKHVFEYPKMYTSDMDFQYSPESGEVSLLNQPGDADRPEVVEMNRVFAGMGEVRIPFKLKFKGDRLVGHLMLIVLRMVKIDVPVDMKDALADFERIKQKTLGITGAAPGTSAVQADAAAGENGGAVGSNTVTNGSGVSKPQMSAKSSMRGSSGWFAIVAAVVVILMPLAEGMTSWLAFA